MDKIDTLDALWCETGCALDFSIGWDSTAASPTPSHSPGCYVARLTIRSSAGKPTHDMEWRYRDVEPFAEALGAAAASILAKIKPCPKCKQKHSPEKKCRADPGIAPPVTEVADG